MPFSLTASFLVYARPSDAKIELLVKQMGLTKEQVEACIQTDPSPNQTDFVTWLARCLRKGQIHLPEDGRKLREQLSAFQVQRRQPGFEGNKDINSYAPDQLFETIERNAATVIRSKNLEKFKGLQGVALAAQEGDLVVYKTRNPEALVMLSDSTNWCTRHVEWASRYMKRGPSFVAFHKGEPYAQIHPASNQFMDRKDRSLYEVFTEKGKGYGAASSKVVGRGVWDPVAKGIVELMRTKDPYFERWADTHLSTDPEELAERLRHSSPDNRLKLALMVDKPLDDERYLYLADSNALLKYSKRFHPGRWEVMEKCILEDRYGVPVGIDYARDSIKGRWPELEPRILSSTFRSDWNAENTVKYAVEVVKGRWPELEKGLLKGTGGKHTAFVASEYARLILKVPWSKMPGIKVNADGMAAPEVMMVRENPEAAVEYAAAFGIKDWTGLKNRFEQQGDYHEYIHYLDKVDGKKRDPKLEGTLLSMPDSLHREMDDKGAWIGVDYAYRKVEKKGNEVAAQYAIEILGGRWPEYEGRLLGMVALKDTPVIEKSKGYNDRSWQFYNGPSSYFYDVISRGVVDYIAGAVKGRWPEFEKVLLDRYGKFPLDWEMNQELVDGYLTILDHLKKEDIPETSWPEGEERLRDRDPEYERYLGQRGRSMTEAAAETTGYNPWEPVYDFEDTIHKYITYLRKNQQDWPEGVKLLNWMEDSRHGQPYGDALGYRLSSQQLLRRRPLLPLPEAT